MRVIIVRTTSRYCSDVDNFAETIDNKKCSRLHFLHASSNLDKCGYFEATDGHNELRICDVSPDRENS